MAFLAHTFAFSLLQHTPAWKDALIRESKTGNLTPEEKKVDCKAVHVGAAVACLRVHAMGLTVRGVVLRSN